MQYIIEIDEKYYVQIFKVHYRLFYIFEMILSILLVLVTGGFVIVFYNHVYISEVIRFVISLIWFVIIIHWPKIHGKYLYFVAKKKKTYGRTLFEFDDNKVKITYLYTNKVCVYNITKIKKVIRLKKYYALFVPRRCIYIPIEDEQNKCDELHQWFQKFCFGKYNIRFTNENF